MSKLLITSGCSFSECINLHIETWPRHLAKKLQEHGYDQHISCAMGSQGNGLISRGPMYEVIKALRNGYKPQDILVGIMWSHSSRFDYYCEHTDTLSWGTENKHSWMVNPRAFVDNATNNWVIGNVHWDSIEFSTFVKFFHSHIGQSIYSLEHILRTQYFLKSKNVPYFFTNFINHNIVHEENLNHIEIKYLLDELDKEQYLPVTSEHGWLIKNSETKDEYLKLHGNAEWIHPKSHHHKEFVDVIIYPWLQEKRYI